MTSLKSQQPLKQAFVGGWGGGGGLWKVVGCNIYLSLHIGKLMIFFKHKTNDHNERQRERHAEQKHWLHYSSQKYNTYFIMPFIQCYSSYSTFIVYILAFNTRYWNR